MQRLLQSIRYRCIANSSSNTDAVVQSILEECLKQEPFLPGGKKRLLDGAGAFSSEIASEVGYLP